MVITMQKILTQLIAGQDLSFLQMQNVMHSIMSGEISDIEIAAFLVALRVKGESVDEIFAAASVMRELSSKVAISANDLLDTCGTGGDGLSTFNISTATALVLASCNIKVAKHGNRSVSSSSGSADLLELAGVNINLTPQQVAKSIKETNLGFMFAPKHHSAMKYAVPVRKALKIRTIFNLLGPLTNPANASYQIMGVFAKKWCLPLAQVLKKFKCKAAIVVASYDGMDEISLFAKTHFASLQNDKITEGVIEPADFGIYKPQKDNITANNPQDSLQIIKDAFAGKNQDAMNIIALNAGVALSLIKEKLSMQDGFKIAYDVMTNNKASEKLAQLVGFTNNF
jgi:anthranilate phosphoribosyltransferase